MEVTQTCSRCLPPGFVFGYAARLNIAAFVFVLCHVFIYDVCVMLRVLCFLFLLLCPVADGGVLVFLNRCLKRRTVCSLCVCAASFGRMA